MRLEEIAGAEFPWHPQNRRSTWRKVSDELPQTGRLAFHYAANFAHHPCRDVTKLADAGLGLSGPRRADNKSDPNLETMSFGMWSTCDQRFRTTMGVKNGRFLFFRTNWPRDDVHIVSGFYDLGWTLESWYVAPPGKRLGARIVLDRFLVANEAHFVGKPLPLAAVAEQLGRTPKEFLVRGVVDLGEKQTRVLRKLLLEQPDATPEYIDEIKRLERCNLSSTGRRYVNWNRIDGFDWKKAQTCIRLASRPRPSAEDVEVWNRRGIVPSKWECAECKSTLASPRAIKICSSCPASGGRILPALKPMKL